MKITKDWEFGVLGLYNYNRPGPFETYFDFIRENHKRMDGDFVEAGVFRGRSALALALFLKELGSDKKVYGFDTFWVSCRRKTRKMILRILTFYFGKNASQPNIIAK
ncbi:MAG TPA: hypothetical protein PKX38_04190 [Alphaproteobacteria bacterium]|nr:hypothetical protein [Alphaproteobacteria bacterium]